MADDKDRDRDRDDADALPEEGETGKKSKKKLILIIAVVLVLLIAGGVALYFSGMLPFGKHKKAEAASSESAGEGHGESADATSEEGGEHGKDGEKKPKIAGAPTFLDMPPFLVNLNTAGTGSDKQTSFLKMTVTLELANEEDSKTVEALMPRIVDLFNTYLRELRAADLAGSAGLTRLREELLLRINKAAYPVQVKDILFREMLVQ